MRSLVNGRESSQVAAEDRGLTYGDGVFETMLARRGAIALWPRHLARLASGCERLYIAMPEGELLESELAQLLEGWHECVVRLTLTRGPGAIGYAAGPAGTATRIFVAREVPRIPERVDRIGIVAAWSELRLAAQPLLAGIKHLNRLEQVLARAHAPPADEVLLADAEGRAVCAGAANLFAVIDGRLVTPSLERCGVAGVARAVIVERLGAIVRDVAGDELDTASEIFLSNAVRGVVPVASIGERRYGVGPVAAAARAALAAEGFVPPRAA